MRVPSQLATLRQFDGTEAILELEEDGVIYAEERVRTTELPASGRHRGAVFVVRRVRANSLEVEYLPSVTDARLSDSPSSSGTG